MTSQRYSPKSRRGVSTIFGVLFLVVILATAVVPMFFYFQQVNGYYDRKVADMKLLDQERAAEDIEFYTAVEDYRTRKLNKTDPRLRIRLFIRNKGSIASEIVRIWAERVDLNSVGTGKYIWNVSFLLPPSVNTDFYIGRVNETDYPIRYFFEPEPGTLYNFQVVTSRGRIFAALNNPLAAPGGGGGGGGGGEYVTHFLITAICYTKAGLENWTVTVTGPDYNYTQGTTSGNPLSIFDPIFAVPWEGTYSISAYTWKKQGDVKDYYGTKYVTLTWDYFNAVVLFGDFPGGGGGGEVPPTETFHDYHNVTTYNDKKAVNKVQSLAQSFIVDQVHTVTHIELLLSRDPGASGTLAIAIKNGLTGNYVAQNMSYDVGSIPTGAPKSLKIPVSPEALLEHGPGYYIILEAGVGNNKNVYWHCVSPADDFPGVAYSAPASGGYTDWSNPTQLDCDFVFGIWGN